MGGWVGWIGKVARKRSLVAVTSAMAVVLGGCRGVGENGGPPPPPPADLNSINHIIILAQENRGFDHYFGSLRQYWAANGIPDQSFDGLPQLNPASGAAPLLGPAPTNLGCDPSLPAPNDCVVNANSQPVESFHMVSMCVENTSPSWNESHTQWNLHSPVSETATLDGFVKAAAHDARADGFHDVEGIRAMSYYDGNDLPYYYFLASNFGTSDRWFSAVMSRTMPNRLYMLAGTSAGHVYPPGPNATALPNPTIFDRLEAAGISWKVYVVDLSRANTPVQNSALNAFETAAKFPDKIVGIDEYFTDLANGTLPAVAYIEPGYNSGLDEHPGVAPNFPGPHLQVGAQFVASLINGLMQSSSWSDSVFIFTYDEGGGQYDHVPPQPAVHPDGVPPSDLKPGDICTTTTGPNCDFNFTGYRVPLIVISPFAKKNYVSHTVADFTAWLKLVETRFGLSSLTQRDAAQMDMTEFFDFDNPPWTTPPTPPAQPTNGPCYNDSLP